MSYGTDKPVMRSAAWRISLWGTLAFACGSMVVFMFLHRFVSDDIQRRSDAWLTGEVGTLSDVASRTPQDRVYAHVVGEVAEMASREVPQKAGPENGSNDSVFFLQTNRDGSPRLWVGGGDGSVNLRAINGLKPLIGSPFDLSVAGYQAPFRVAVVSLADGSHIYLGLSERDELRVLRNLRVRFSLLWLLNVLLGFAIVFSSARRMLGDVREITQAASGIGEADLSSRVPTSGKSDEVAQLASTLNRMLDRIERTVHQLHTITDSLAHDLRSPLTAIRAKLEMALTEDAGGAEAELIVSAVDEVDRLTEMLTRSLDVAESHAGALRLHKAGIDLAEMLEVMTALYEPCMADRALRIRLSCPEHVEVSADPALLHRMLANLLDNEMKHLPSACEVQVRLAKVGEWAELVIEDDGPGFDAEVIHDLFKPGVKGGVSTGHGLGLAFVEAVVLAHGGEVEAVNRSEGGARISIRLRLALAVGAGADVEELVAGLPG